MRRVLLLSLLLLASCTREKKTIVGVVPKGANHIFWQTVHAGAIKAAQEYGFEVEWNAPTLEIDSSRQIEIVQDDCQGSATTGQITREFHHELLVAEIERRGRFIQQKHERLLRQHAREGNPRLLTHR